MKLDTLSHAELFEEISDLAKEQGVASQDVWNELVSEVLESHLALGELDKDMDLENLRTILSNMWTQYEREASAEMDAEPQDKDNTESTEQLF
ncbi:hypothetical protein HZC53_03635 [Candidatus Uhrbacteria bacterium]|nr:hypothetical protein [Candidatus Uhrbacteria bacterium]